MQKLGLTSPGSNFRNGNAETERPCIVCIKTIVRERRIPFIIEAPLVPNAETIAAMEEGDRIVNDPTRKHFTNLEEFWKDLES